MDGMSEHTTALEGATRTATSGAAAEGSGSTSWMRREIGEQPLAVARTVSALRDLVPQIRNIGKDTRQVLFIARGSSDNAAVYGQYLCAVRGGRLATLASPSIATAYRARLDLSGVLAVAVSQSGATEEIVETLAWARDCGARTIGVTNVADSPLAELADVALITQAGHERAVPATKTHTTALAALATLGLALQGDDAAQHELDAVPEAIEAMLATADAAARLAERLTYVAHLVVSGRGYASSTALELALKLKEACYVTAVGLSYADLLHGPIAVVDPDTPALLVAAGDGPVLPGMTSLAGRVSAAGADVYGIGGDRGFVAACRAALPGPALPEHLAPLALVVPGQLLVEALARAKGIDPDSPRGLRKVTQTEERADASRPTYQEDA
jgi:fructoselysine-6-P-deglycase FrlB-like protein